MFHLLGHFQALVLHSDCSDITPFCMGTGGHDLTPEFGWSDKEQIIECISAAWIIP